MDRLYRKTFTLSLSYLGVLLVFTSAEEPMLLLWVPTAVAASVVMLARHVRLPRIARPVLTAGRGSLAGATNAPLMWNDVWTGRVLVAPDQAAA